MIFAVRKAPSPAPFVMTLRHVRPTMQVLYGQPEHLSTSYQTEQLMRAARTYFDVQERHFASKETGWTQTQFRRLWTNLIEPRFCQHPSDYLFYGNDGFADLRLWKNRRVVYWYDAPWDYAATPPRIRQWKDWLRCENIRCADDVLAVSEVQVRTARKLRPGREGSVHYLPVGVDCQHYRPENGLIEDVRAIYALPADSVVIGYLGYIGLVAGRAAGQVLVECAPAVIRREKRAHFLIVGYGPGLETLRQLVAQNKMEVYFTFTGYIPATRLPSFIASMDICIDTLEPGFHSEARSETKLKQYMAMGRACVATAIGENIVDLEDGKCGRLVEPGADPLSEGIVSLIRRPTLRDSYGRLCRARAVLHYHWPVLAKRMANALSL